MPQLFSFFSNIEGCCLQTQTEVQVYFCALYDYVAKADPFTQSTLPHTILTPICIRSVFFLLLMQFVYPGYWHVGESLHFFHHYTLYVYM